MGTVDCDHCGSEVVVEDPEWDEEQTYYRLTSMLSQEEQIDFFPSSHVYCGTECVVEALEGNNGN